MSNICRIFYNITKITAIIVPSSIYSRFLHQVTAAPLCWGESAAHCLPPPDYLILANCVYYRCLEVLHQTMKDLTGNKNGNWIMEIWTLWILWTLWIIDTNLFSFKHQPQFERRFWSSGKTRHVRTDRQTYGTEIGHIDVVGGGGM